MCKLINNVTENQRGNQDWTIQQHWQYWVHKTQEEDKQNKKHSTIQGRIQDFKLGGAHIKKLRRAERGAKIFGYFVWKITILRQKIIFFPILGGGARPPPESAPAICVEHHYAQTQKHVYKPWALIQIWITNIRSCVIHPAFMFMQCTFPVFTCLELWITGKYKYK